mmetsp:Transcript_63091/g.100271  ORF Transcript_63091/g.100271 Transcript_63091/m.100271 type:complete len:703 (-) Transcript_63091:101-2209(-)
MYGAAKRGICLKYHHHKYCRTHTEHLRNKQLFHSSSTFITCHYKTLGITQTASDKEIRTAYIQMAKKYHPDVNTDKDSTSKFSTINEAYSILSDRLKKEKYDLQIGNSPRRHSSMREHAHSAKTNKSGKNWWDFNFYGTNTNHHPHSSTSNSSHSSSKRPRNDPFDGYSDYETQADFEYARDFYGDFSRFSSNVNNRKRKRNVYENNNNNDDKSNSNNNPYADYYYYYQQVHSESGRKPQQQTRYENIWTEFEFDFDVEQEFDSEFNNEAFWRFLRNNNKKYRAKHEQNQNPQENHNEPHHDTNNNNNNNGKKKSKIKAKPEQKEKNKEKAAQQNNGSKQQTSSKSKRKDAKTDKEAQDGEASSATKSKQFRKDEVSMNDIELDLNLNFLDAVNGCIKTINFTRREMCNHCGGTSFEPSIEAMKCIKCDGKGCILGYGNDFVTHKCINCNGRGMVFKNCLSCNGKSTVSLSKSLKITIPSGIRQNDRVRVSGQGHHYVAHAKKAKNAALKHGHIWIHCKIAEHEFFKRSGNDIHITMNIPYVLAVLGGSFVVPTIDGPNILKVLPGIQSNDYEVMQGKGVYDKSTNKKGNQYIHFVINIPNESEISEQQKQLLNEYAKLERPPTPVEMPENLNLKHFKKHGHRVQTYQQQEEEMRHKHEQEEEEEEVEEEEQATGGGGGYYYRFDDDFDVGTDTDDELSDIL